MMRINKEQKTGGIERPYEESFRVKESWKLLKVLEVDITK